MANTHWGTHSSDHLPFNEQLISSSQQRHEAGTIINTQQSKEKELSSQIIWVLLLLRFLSNLWLLVLASARALGIIKGRGGLARFQQQKNAESHLPMFPARRGCPAAARGPRVASALTAAAAVSHQTCINLAAAERCWSPSYCTGTFSPWWDALETEMPFCSGMSVNKGAAASTSCPFPQRLCESQMHLALAQRGCPKQPLGCAGGTDGEGGWLCRSQQRWENAPKKSCSQSCSLTSSVIL